jgi:membrane-bound lytic murein transglycosylase MltF
MLLPCVVDVQVGALTKVVLNSKVVWQAVPVTVVLGLDYNGGRPAEEILEVMLKLVTGHDGKGVFDTLQSQTY